MACGVPMTPEITNGSKDDERLSIIANALLANNIQSEEWRSHLVHESSAGFFVLESEAEEYLCLEHRPRSAHWMAGGTSLSPC